MADRFELPGERPLEGLLDLPARAAPAPVVVVCHGFKGFADWGFFPALAALLAERGVAAVRFNFRGSGMRLGEDRVGDLEAFRAQTIAGELADLQQVVAALPTLAPSRLDLDRLALFGHSRGAGTALLAAAAEPLRSRLRALVTWAAVATFDRLDAAQKEHWRESGSYRVVNARTGQQLPIGLALLDDVESHREAYDLRAAAGRRRAPWLLVHGEQDETVPVAEGEALAAAAREAGAATAPCAWVRLPGGDHTFGSRHPFERPTPALATALEHTQRWLLRWLRAA